MKCEKLSNKNVIYNIYLLNTQLVMRHKKKRSIVLNTWVQKRSNVMRNMLTSLVLNGKMVTTYRRAIALKASADSFFSRMVKINKNSASEKDAQRELWRFVKSVLYTEKAGKKAIKELLPKFLASNNSSFIADYKLWFRVWDAAEKILVKII